MMRVRFTGKVLAKKRRFSSDMNPPPLITTVIKNTNLSTIFGIDVCYLREPNLKSVDGSLPCHPISFHWSDIKASSFFSGYVADHNALSASWWSGRDASKQLFILFVSLFSLSSWKEKTHSYGFINSQSS